MTDNSTTPNIEGSPSSAPLGATTKANRQGRPEIRLAASAAKLSVTEEAPRSALGPPPPDLVAAAATLGVTGTALIAALVVPAQP